jgi:predicted NAD/FAD-dependent oxidoreductase
MSSAGPRIAIIGAGMAGLACARALQSRGLPAVLFDKSRGPGGRIATRRIGYDLGFDHGAQYVTAQGGAFRTLLDELVARGTAARWLPAGVPREVAAPEWIVGVPGINTLVRPLAEGLELRAAAEVVAVERKGGGWQLQYAGDAAADIFDIVVSTVPSPQARRLLAGEAAIAQALDGVMMEPCWALMAVFAAPVSGAPDVLQPESDTWAWLCRNSAKPQRDAARECWIAHATRQWSRQHLELEREAAAVALIDALPRVLGGMLPRIEQAVAHRWRFARATQPLGRPFLCNDDRTLFAGGDWALGARLECAFDSGTAIAEAIAAR